jgi:hypothetical protein
MNMDRLTLTLDIRPNDIGLKEVNVRSNLVVANLIAEIQDKFNIDGTLGLNLEGTEESLSLNTPLDQTDITDGSTLICERVMEETGTLDYIERGIREPFEEDFKRVYLQEQRTLNEYDLTWQPAIIGRKDHRNPSNNRLLAVDLEDAEDLPTVSRHHACITLREGSFFIETIQARNPTFLDETRLKQGIKYPLAAGSVIQVSRLSLTLFIIS